ncbi:MAG: DUF3634 family protein [Myxococcota bacterium]|nr:DUF3634 family protein [Myxococcota bacterium]
MDDLLPWIVLALVGVGAWYFLSRANEIFCVSVRDGRLLLVRGRIPIALKHDFEDVVRRARLQRATIRAVSSQSHARLVMSGVDEHVAQRLRNTFGHHPIQKLRSAPAKYPRNLGQVLGIAWLAWLFVGRR